MKRSLLACLSLAGALLLGGGAEAQIKFGGPGVEGALMSFGPEPRDNPAVKDVVAEFKAKGY
jgi:hypothetical protein